VSRSHRCARCEAQARSDRELCWRCHAREQTRQGKAPCPGCTGVRRLDPVSGLCALCGRGCSRCQTPVRSPGRALCHLCQPKAKRQAQQALCCCGRTGYLRPDTQLCGMCTRLAAPKPPPKQAACTECGQLARNAGHGLCPRCWQRKPERPFIAVEGLILRLQDPPPWLRGFATFSAARHCPARACRLLSTLGRLLRQAGPVSNQSLLEQTRQSGRSMGTLGRSLEEFLVAEGLAFGLDQEERLARGRRTRRIDATPPALRPAVAAFADTQITNRERARRSGTKPRADHTIESNLAVVRDFALLLTDTIGKQDWALVTAADVEAFLAQRPANRPRCLGMLCCFFRWAKKNRLVLIDPTRGLSTSRHRGFTGQTLTKAEQRQLLRRWTGGGSAVHPHEAVAGVLSLLHATSASELRGLRLDDVNFKTHELRIGRRPYPVPLDPVSWNVLEGCLAHRTALATQNPHLLVTRTTRTRSTQASMAYLAHVLDPASTTARTLRSTRLVHLVATLDVKLVAAAFGLDEPGVIAYLPEQVDQDRLAKPVN
jgi:integrase